MSERLSSVPRGVAAIAAALALVLAFGLVSAASGGDQVVRAKKVKVKCPAQVTGGKKVTCKIKGKLPKGPQGETGPAGQAGAPGLSGYEIIPQTFVDVFAQNSGGQRGLSEVKTVACPAGKRAIGGGVDLGTDATENGAQRQMVLSASYPTAAGDGWNVQLFNNSTSVDIGLDVRVYAICATVT